MFSFLFGLVWKTFTWAVETIATATLEIMIFGQKGDVYLAKKKKKKSAMTKKNTSPSKKQRKKASQCSGGYSSLDYLSPGAKGHVINSGGPKK